jgi:hypothetical protein
MNHAAVATPHRFAADTARQILQSGGNAIDAAVGAMITLCVVLPGMVGLGGFGGTMVLHSSKKRKTVAIDFDSRCPAAFHEGLQLRTRRKRILIPRRDRPGDHRGADFTCASLKSHVEARFAARRARGKRFSHGSRDSRQLDKWHAVADPISRDAFFPGGRSRRSATGTKRSRP